MQIFLDGSCKQTRTTLGVTSRVLIVKCSIVTLSLLFSLCFSDEKVPDYYSAFSNFVFEDLEIDEIVHTRQSD